MQKMINVFLHVILNLHAPQLQAYIELLNQANQLLGSLAAESIPYK